MSGKMYLKVQYLKSVRKNLKEDLKTEINADRRKSIEAEIKWTDMQIKINHNRYLAYKTFNR
jgi:hypothetical protein